MSNADDYNEDELAAGRLKPAHVSELAAFYQERHGLVADGKAGPRTRALLEDARRAPPSSPIATSPREALPVISVSESGWLTGEGVVAMPIHRSWYYPRLSTATGKPAAIVAHYTSTAHGTADNMARNRAEALKPTDRPASWHVSVEGDGTILQMAPLLAGCWHAGGPSAKPIPGVGPANRTALGIELVGHGDAFPEAQVVAACRLWRALVRAYAIPRNLAMVTHQELDPTRKTDPGPVWIGQHADRVLNYALG